jgi:predicted RNA-binding Zn ribbon-like protein
MGDDSLRLAPGLLATVQEFVNSKNVMRGYDRLADSGEASAWLAARGLLEGGEVLREADRRRLVDFREGLRGLLLAHNGGAPEEPAPPEVSTLNELLETFPMRVSFAPDGEPHLSPQAGGSAGGAMVMGRVLAAVLQAASEGTWARLKACRNEGCRWAFYDASKNRSGRWCTMEICGARAKMRAYRSRASG